MKYADLVVDWLKQEGYTHCFSVAGGNAMHLLDAVRRAMVCVPVVHEVAAGIAVEYFNEAADDDRKAFALVTAGPGLTNIVTALGGAYLESRELLVLGGQVKTSDLATDGIRQRGIQEIDGVSIVRPVTVLAERIDAPVDRERFTGMVGAGRRGRPGPVFIEICLDVQGAPVERDALEGAGHAAAVPAPPGQLGGGEAAAAIAGVLSDAQRPLLLLGGGVSRAAAAELRPRLNDMGIPVMTTWNAMDRMDAGDPVYAGRPNTWGQRAANILVQQADVLVALGSRLGLQQSGFNWQQFVPAGRIVQVDIDPAELSKGHPHVDIALQADADDTLRELCVLTLPEPTEWMAFCDDVRAELGHDDEANVTSPGYLSPYRFVMDLARLSQPGDVVIPCSSGGAFTTMMQAFDQKAGQVVITDKALASMGYGLSGALGAACAHPGRRVVLVEGDGGFSQNLQELATVAVNRLPIKIFLYANEGYASIRMTQRNYFGGEYLGCDTATGLGFADWPRLFDAFGIDVTTLDAGWTDDPGVMDLWNSDGPAGFVVPIDPEQTYFPKISSRVAADGGMESNPLHLMSPDLSPEVAERVFRFLDPRWWRTEVSG